MKTSKRWLALLLAMLLMLTCLAGCGSKDKDEPEEDAAEKETSDGGLAESFEDADDVAYVLIYNPDIYNEESSSNVKLDTGDFDRDMIDTSAVRADDTEEESELAFVSQRDTLGGLDFSAGEIEPSDRADDFVTPFQVGDTHDFCYNYIDGTDRTTFECIYAGEHANVWIIEGSDDLSGELAEKYGQCFDEEIYDLDVELYGEPRFAENGGNVNLLFYPMSGGVCGFFSPIDNLTEDELVLFAGADPEETAEMNSCLAIVHINTNFATQDKYFESTCATLAHEFQHQINCSSWLDTSRRNLTMMHTWLNEAMSGYVEEVLAPGSKETDGHYRAFARSDLIRHGQSLYNFDNNSRDIGVYGSVYLYSEFLHDLGGDGVFHAIHDYWRNSSSAPTEEAALVEALGDDVVTMIDESIVFPEEVSFRSDDEEFMSKLTLAFYFSLLNGDPTQPDAYANVKAQALFYDELDGCDIEGGGRVIVATKDGSFEIPEDADSGLVYIGLDENFQPVTTIIYGE